MGAPPRNGAGCGSCGRQKRWWWWFRRWSTTSATPAAASISQRRSPTPAQGQMEVNAPSNNLEPALHRHSRHHPVDHVRLDDDDDDDDHLSHHHHHHPAFRLRGGRMATGSAGDQEHEDCWVLARGQVRRATTLPDDAGILPRDPLTTKKGGPPLDLRPGFDRRKKSAATTVRVAGVVGICLLAAAVALLMSGDTKGFVVQGALAAQDQGAPKGVDPEVSRASDDVNVEDDEVEDHSKQQGGGHHHHHHHHSSGCNCMEYWTCILGGGSPYSYCGVHAHDVCCFVPDNAEPVGILPTPTKFRCGRKGFDSGQDGEAEMAEWPWHAAILEKPQDLYVCGSTLLDESWILTAAHCVDDYLPFASNIDEILKVRLGEYDVSTTAEPLRHEEFNVTDIVVYPGFNNSTLVHDIALLRLQAPAKRKQNIDVVCMPKVNDFSREEVNKKSANSCFVTGWGRRTETSEHSLVLKEIKVPLWNHDSCNGALQAQFGPAYVLPNTAICAGAEGRDACDGDGGGPLVCEKDGQWYQVGIVSFGIGCGRQNVPGVYTNVGMYRDWIEDVILTSKANPGQEIRNNPLDHSHDHT